ncbi:bacterial regulatory s, tetR family protein [Mycobacterium xenopi 3993]|nr:bacterial regulatory s, tetR family protein [Mycobacterium xenopi 3993]
MRELLEEKPFTELSVSTISDRAGVARSGFYFYFDSKYAVLAQILAEATHELEELTEYFAPRRPDESPAAFAKRMVGSAAAVYAHNDPVMSACNAARNTDAEIRKILDQQVDTVIEQIIRIVEEEIKAGTAHPISDDIPALVRTLAVTTALMLSGDTTFLVPTGTCSGAFGCWSSCGSTRCGWAGIAAPVWSPPWRRNSFPGISRVRDAFSPARPAASAAPPRCGSPPKVPNCI